jgi:hypothetical protein
MTEKIEPLRVEDAEVPGFDARPLMLSASELANHVTLRKSSTVEAGHPVDVGSSRFINLFRNRIAHCRLAGGS